MACSIHRIICCPLCAGSGSRDDGGLCLLCVGNGSISGDELAAMQRAWDAMHDDEFPDTEVCDDAA